MNSVERVKAICKERKIPISRLERELGYANGYIGQLKKGVFPDDRLAEISQYLSVSVEFLMNGVETGKATTPVSESGRHVNIVTIAGRDGSYMEKHLTDEQVKALQTIIDQMPEAPDDL